MRATILHLAIILTKVHTPTAAVSIMVLHLMVFLILTTQLYQFFSVFFLFGLFTDEPEVFLPEYSQTAILLAANFRRVVN